MLDTAMISCVQTENQYLYRPNNDHSSNACGFWEKHFVWMIKKIQIFYFAALLFYRPARIRKAYRNLMQLRRNIWGADLKKLYRVGGRYYHNMYVPGWPSKAYNHVIKGELKRHTDEKSSEEKLRFVFLAITRKCPQRCEHCFEWNNLNQPESFTKQDLQNVLELFQNKGVKQFHFSGGEPMVRLKDLLELLALAKGKSECWVVTSGFNLNHANARLLQSAGCFGVTVSIDHYIPELHDIFRGYQGSFERATAAVQAAKDAGLVTALSVCATKSFIESGHLMPYMKFAKSLGVQFVQVLEPRNIGHYAGKNVLLEEKHIQSLEKFFKKINHRPEFSEYPILMYHGYYQRRIGCFSGGRNIYVDSAGDVHACPFCHTKSYNIIELVRQKGKALPPEENTCPLFEKIA